MRKFQGLLILSAVLAVAACGGAKESAPPADEAAAPAAAPATTGAAPAAAAAPAVAEFGVPECDTYMTKYRECVDKNVPEAQRAAMKQGFDQMAAAWRQAASMPQGKESLKMGCTQALAQAKTAMKPYNCSW